MVAGTGAGGWRLLSKQVLEAYTILVVPTHILTIPSAVGYLEELRMERIFSLRMSLGYLN